MRISIHDTGAGAAAAVARRIAERVRETPRAVLGLATGGTMEPVYAALIAAHRAGLSFSRAVSFNLDEYVGLPPDHPQSYRRYMDDKFANHVDMDPTRRFLPRGDVDPALAAVEYERRLAEHGPIDLQLLGIGRNGHIGFNEPGSAMETRTREVALTESTRWANARFFAEGEHPPTTAITMGIATILDAYEIVLLAVGRAKAEAVAAMIEGPLTLDCPATALQHHGRVHVVVDRGAAAGLSTQTIWETREP